jgi:hypothetical protein
VTIDGTDCDDGDADVHPGAVDVPQDGIDQDCDTRNACVVDDDDDGVCADQDCDDHDPGRYPGAFEACDGVDDDCNGVVDDRAAPYYVDADYDGYGDEDIPPLVLCPEEPPPPLPVGAGTYVAHGGDCDDTTTFVNPAHPEWCDGIDNDCDGRADEDIPLRPAYIDRDRDGFGDPDPTWSITVQCPPGGYSPFPTDCDDHDASVHPLIDQVARTFLPLADAPLEASEADRDPAFVADGVDEDCDLVDVCYADADDDGFGDPDVFVRDTDLNCRNASAPTASNPDDCDDGDPTANPIGIEVPGDGEDQDCDGADDCFIDLDGDGWGTSEVVIADDLDCDDGSQATASRPGDCLDEGDLAGAAHPGSPEVCNGIDDNCDGRVDDLAGQSASEWYLDADGDGWGDVTEKLVGCGAPADYVDHAGDCDDADPGAFPDNTEVCNGVDDNCRAGIDEDCGPDDSDGDTDPPATQARGGCHAWGGAYACLAVMPLSWLRRRRR